MVTYHLIVCTVFFFQLGLTIQWPHIHGSRYIVALSSVDRAQVPTSLLNLHVTKIFSEYFVQKQWQKATRALPTARRVRAGMGR
jgi:hypothetical protein